VENLTPELILGIASAFVLLANAGEKIAQIIRAAKAPNDIQNDRLDKVEKRLDAVESKLDNDNVRLAAIADDNRITQRALLALLDHGIDGNNIKQMQDAKEDLYMHLTEKK
jgi:hypothetical protein